MLYLECDCCTDTVGVEITELDIDNSAKTQLPSGWEVFRFDDKQYTVCSADCRGLFEDDDLGEKDELLE